MNQNLENHKKILKLFAKTPLSNLNSDEIILVRDAVTYVIQEIGTKAYIDFMLSVGTHHVCYTCNWRWTGNPIDKCPSCGHGGIAKAKNN